ncbi:MAG: hypothetical protein AMXMBFR66_07460 [Pseudomonadota bacterium]|nr:hypothetical protein [Rubrivivax sp.]
MGPLVKYLLLPLTVLAALVATWLWLAWSWSYSSGERAGWVQQFSKRGWICKTWEGELALVSLPGSTTEKFFFTVHDDAVAARITRLMGKRVALHYEEKVGLPTTCFGETRSFVTDVSEAEDIPLGPGVVLPTAPAAPAAAPAASATASAPR